MFSTSCDGCVELFAYCCERFPRLGVILRANLRARFLQALPRIREYRPWGAQFLRRHLRRLGGGAAGASSRVSCVEAAAIATSVVALGLALAVGRPGAGVLGPLPRVDGVAEGLAVVALIDGGVRLLHARRGGGVFLRRVDLGAGGAGEIDGGLGLVDFFLRRLGTAVASSRMGEEPCDPRSSRPKATHGGKV